MVRFAAWGWVATLGMCATGALLAAEPVRKPWYAELWGSSSGHKPKSEKSMDRVDPVVPEPKPRVPPREEALRLLQAEQAEYLRRLDICTRFKQWALETQNEEMLRRAEELEIQAEQIYRQKIAHLPVARLTPSESERLLDQHLGTGVAADPLRAPASDKTADRTAKATAKGERR